MQKITKSVLPLLIVLLLVVACGGGGGENSNPFFSDYNTKFSVPPFDQIESAHFVPAFEEGIRQQEVEIEQIVSNGEAPTFANTIEAYEYSGELLNKVAPVFSNYSSSNTSTEIQQIEAQITPLLSTHDNNILLNAGLFQRIKIVYDQRDELGLTSEQLRLLEKTYKYFALNGAQLPVDQQERFRAINNELSLLTMNFDQNVLKDVNDYKMIVSRVEDLAGLPQSVIETAALKATNEGLANSWVFTLQNSSVMPFLSYADNRELRKTMQQAYINRGNNNNAYDNKVILAKIVSLRLELAQMLGYETYAELQLADRMAGNSKTVMTFLNEVWDPALDLAKRESGELQTMLEAEGQGLQLEQWDWRYYAEKVRKQKYDLDEEAIRPYLELNTVRAGLFSVLAKLYGLQFVERSDIPRILPDVQAFEVKEADGSSIGIIYLDLYARDNKISGAWMSSYRKQQVDQNGVFVQPIVTVAYNFSPPTDSLPSLLTRDEMVIFFHEFGHAMHGLLSKVTYRSLSGTNTPRDFVEFPSQIMENWARDPSVIQMFARHYETGEPIPQALLDSIEASANFNKGFEAVELLASSILDMEYHSITDPFAESQLGEVASTVEELTISHTGLIPEIYFRHGSTHFLHIFAGGYAAGYYSYWWSGMLDADAFEAFRETGDLFDQATAQSFRKNVLEKGDTRDAMQMYIDFRGRSPQIEALLRQRGLL